MTLNASDLKIAKTSVFIDVLTLVDEQLMTNIYSLNLKCAGLLCFDLSLCKIINGTGFIYHILRCAKYHILIC